MHRLLGHEAATQVFVPASALGVPHDPATQARLVAPQFWQACPPVPQLSCDKPPLHAPASVQQPMQL
jgi:hypothetical protein